jgi:hypothetical protein
MPSASPAVSGTTCSVFVHIPLDHLLAGPVR